MRRPRAVKPEYEYEEELYLALDGSATLNVNASVASLVALRGVDLDPDPRARARSRTRARVVRRSEACALGQPVAARRPPLRPRERRGGRRAPAGALAPFAWSSYRFDREGDVMEFRQVVGPPAAGHGGRRSVDRPGAGRVPDAPAERDPVPQFAVRPCQRGNILEWDQPLADRLKGVPLELQVQLEPESILYTTLLLFGSTIVAAAVTFALVIWWIARRGRTGRDGGVSLMNKLGFGAKPAVLRCGRCGKFVDWEDARLQVVCPCRPHLELPPVLVREATPADREKALELFRRDFGPAQLVAYGEAVSLDDAPALVAETEGEIGGALAWRHFDGALHILALATDPMWQRAGVGGPPRGRGRAAGAASGTAARDRDDYQRQPPGAVLLSAPGVSRVGDLA